MVVAEGKEAGFFFVDDFRRVKYLNSKIVTALGSIMWLTLDWNGHLRSQALYSFRLGNVTGISY